jgi:RNA polymerase sigma-70 factor (ECF subfamily)
MDHDQIRGLYEQYASWVFNRAKSFLKNDEAAWEAVQDVFVKVLEVGDRFRGDSSPWTWIYRITTNHCLNLIRSRKTWQNVAGAITREQLALNLDGGQNQSQVLVDSLSFVELMKDEDETMQQILIAYYRDEMTQDEISDMIGISRKTIYKRLKKFEDRIKKEGAQ